MTRIRTARPGDLDRLQEIEIASFPGDRISRRAMGRLIRSPSCRFLVEETGRVIRGMAVLTFRRGGRSVRLYSLVTDAAHRGAGVATALMDRAERWARREGFDRLTLEVRRDNAGAIRFYEARGYALLAVVDDYYDDGCPARRYGKELRKAGSRE
jgi:ribosomal protein S18 acetylase RimI-like enzyme